MTKPSQDADSEPLHNLQARMDLQEVELQRLKAVAEALNAARLAAEESARQASLQRDHVVGSLTWRAARPFHRLDERVPQPVRTMLHNALESVFRLAARIEKTIQKRQTPTCPTKLSEFETTRRSRNADLSDDVSAIALATVEALGVSDDEAKSERQTPNAEDGPARYAQWISEREGSHAQASDLPDFESAASKSSATLVSFLIVGVDSQTINYERVRTPSSPGIRRSGTPDTGSQILPSPDLFRPTIRTLQSIREQTNPQWEAVVGLSPNENGSMPQEIKSVFGQDQRFVQTDLHASDKASALADLLPMTKGDFIAVLDPGDVLAPFAIEEIQTALSLYPGCSIFYSDEDRLSDSGQRKEPFFKPEWSPELLYAFNYFGRLTVIRRPLAIGVGGFAQDLGAAVEWDLNLRLTETGPQIRRITKVLCHRAAASDRDRPLPGTAEASFHHNAIEKFWSARGIAAQVETQNDGTQRSFWSLTHPPLVSIIIPSKNRCALLQVCVGGILEKTDYQNKEVIIVDNASDEPDTIAYYETLRGHPSVKIARYNRAFNYSAVCNYGASIAKGELLLFLNNDIEVHSSDWLAELVRVAMRPGVGVVGTKLLYPSHALQHAGVVLGIHFCGLMFRNAPENEWGIFGSPNVPRNYLAIMGACQLIRREVFTQLGGFDEAYQIANGDVAFCLRAWRAGYRIAYTPFASLIHHEGASRGYSNPMRDLQLTAADIRRFGIAEDPYFHPELSATSAIPMVRLGQEPSSREDLAREVDKYLCSLPPTSILGLYGENAGER
jgi:GT2 family glycosyltransferase